MDCSDRLASQQPLIVQRVMHMGFSRDDAEDAVQFAFVQMLRGKCSSTVERGAIAWLTTVARHQAYTFWHQRQRERLIDERPWEARAALEFYGDRFTDGEPLQHLAVTVEDDDRLEAREFLEWLASDARHGEKVALFARILGLSYEETMEATGQTYTWVNRYTKEGRDNAREALAA